MKLSPCLLVVNHQSFPCLDTSTSWSSCSRKIIRIIYISIPKPMICTNQLIKSQSKFANSWSLNTHDFLESVNWNYMISILKSMNLPKQLEPATVWAPLASGRPGGLELVNDTQGRSLEQMGGVEGEAVFDFWKKCPRLLVSLSYIFYMEGVLLFFGRNPANQLICSSLSHTLHGFIHPRWLFGISSINSRELYLEALVTSCILRWNYLPCYRFAD